MYFVKIKRIKKLGKRKTFDISVPIYNNFILGNYLLTHNSGKSSAAIMLAREYCKVQGIRFDPARHIAYNNADVMRKINELNKFEPLIADEAVRFASAAEWARRENKNLKKRLAEIRTKHLLFILCYPLKITRLEKNYVDSFVNIWCLTGDTKIKVKINKLEKEIEIEKLVYMKNYKVLTFNDKNNLFEYQKPKKTILTKHDITYKLELKNGNIINATKNHFVLTPEGYKKIEYLTFNDSVCVCSNNLLYSDIKKVTVGKKIVPVYDIIGTKNHNFIANGMIVHNCDIYTRGSGALFVKDLNPVTDSWRLTEFKDIGSYNEFNEDNYIEKTLKKHPNFWHTIKFPKPPKWLYDKYLLVREKNVYDDSNVLVNVTREDVYNALLILTLRDIMLHDVSLNLNRILLHIKNTYDLDIKKGYVEAAMEDAKQLVAKMREDGMNFFEKENENNLTKDVTKPTDTSED